MTVSSTTRAAGPFTGNGVSTVFAFNFKAYAGADVQIQVTDTSGTVTTLTSGYSITLNANQDISPGGVATLSTALATGYKLVAVGARVLTQSTDLRNGSSFNADAIELGLDCLEIQLQELALKHARSLQLPVASYLSGVSTDLPTPIASQILAWDAGGTAITTISASTLAIMAGVVAAGQLSKNDLWLDAQPGIDLTGNTDSTAGWNNAIAAANLLGARVRIGGGALLLRGAQVNYPVDIVGSARYRTALFTDSDTGSVIVVNSTHEVSITDLNVRGTNTATAGALVKLNGSGANSFSRIENVLFQAGWTHIDTDASSAWTIRRNYFTGFKQYGVFVANSVNADSGDSTLDGNVFSNAANANAICIGHQSSGGLRIINNKLNTGLYGYRMQLVGATSDLVISGNSFENATQTAIALFRTSGSFNNVVISGNQIALSITGIAMNDPSHFFDTASITGNVMTAIRDYGIIVDSANQVTIDGNTIAGLAGSGIQGITLGASSNAILGANKISGFATRVKDLSTTGSLVMHRRPLLTFAGLGSSPVDTTEDILASCYIPGGVLGLTAINGGMLTIKLAASVSANANTKTLRVRIGGLAGTLIGTLSVPSGANQVRAELSMGVAGASVQVVTGQAQYDTAVVAIGPSTPTIDFSSPLQLVITGQKAVSGDSLILQSALVELIA